MKAIHLTTCAVAVLTGLGVSSSARAQDDSQNNFHFPVGIAYSTGIQNAQDKLVDFYKQDGYHVSGVEIPLGLVFDPYYEWPTSFGGIGAGVTVGPTAFMAVDNVSYDNVSFSYAVPVGPFIRYTPWPKAAFSPYVRAGVRYVIAGGAFDSSDVGVFGAVGLELWRTKRAGVSLEAGYDSSQLKVNYTGRYGQYTDKVNFPGFTVGLSVLF